MSDEREHEMAVKRFRRGFGGWICEAGHTHDTRREALDCAPAMAERVRRADAMEGMARRC